MESNLPLFPLKTVLFPGQLLPLHIFEPRYREMVQECVRTSQPFGVVFIREGEETGAAAQPYDVGTTARIIQMERLPDGRLNILCLGDARFRIRETNTERAYLQGRVDLWPWEPAEAETIQPVCDRVQSRLKRYLELLSQATNSRVQIDPPNEPAALANMAGAVLQIDPIKKQQLLGTPSIEALLKMIADLLQQEIRGLRIMLASQPQPRDESIPFSLN
jgi:Lon protease-like protein